MCLPPGAAAAGKAYSSRSDRPTAWRDNRRQGQEENMMEVGHTWRTINWGARYGVYGLGVATAA